MLDCSVGRFLTAAWALTSIALVSIGGSSRAVGQSPADNELPQIDIVTDHPIRCAPSPEPWKLSLNVSEGDSLQFTVVTSDSDGGDISLEVGALPARAQMEPPLPFSGNPASSTLSWQPNYEEAGTYDLIFTATDSQGGQAICRVIIRVLIETVLVADPLIGDLANMLKMNYRFRARLTERTTGRAVSAKIVSFREGGAVGFCEATTDDSGFAQCGRLEQIVIAALFFEGYFAYFAGDGVYSDYLAWGPLVRVLGIDVPS